MVTNSFTESSAIPSGDQKRSTAEVLKRARALIEKPDDWSHGLSIGGSRRCVLFAIEDALGRHAPMSPACEVFCEASGATIGDIGGWNDAPERTHAEVLAAFDRAIELATNSETGSPVARDQSNGQSLSKEA